MRKTVFSGSLAFFRRGSGTERIGPKNDNIDKIKE